MNTLKPGRLFNILQCRHYYQPLSWPDDSHDWEVMPPALAGILLEFMEVLETPETINLTERVSLQDANNWILDAYRRGQSLGW